MFRRRARVAVVVGALFAVGATSVLAAPASAGNFEPNIIKWVVTGSLTAKKLNQPVVLPPGSEFNGSADLQLEGLEKIHGTLQGNVTVPPFSTTLTILGVPTPITVDITFNQNREAIGTVDTIPPANCGVVEGCLALRIPTQASIGLTAVGILGIKVPLRCETSEPVSLFLSEDLTLLELVGEPGPRFKGTATIPSIKCPGLQGIVLGPVLSAALSGPENPFEINIKPPPPKPKPKK